ncbi:nitrilase-related carbon-nitrogen hydrolase [Kushneria phosphatilytica]|nr:nitrilase-related carbon-nitrogen hydrolase [Kushneria phosphatilytica]OHV08643.1 hypothetical protein BH688_11405 [Kushneria phosphatilytica]
MTHSLTLGLAQLTPKVGHIDANLASLGQTLKAHPEVDLMVLPELFLGGYTTRDPAAGAVTPEDVRIHELSELARRHDTALILGAAEHYAGGIANSALCLDRRGQLLGSYRKAQLFGDESTVFTAGDALTVIEFDGVRIGLMICFDLEFPEVARALAREGADLLVTISANMTPFGQDHHVFARARAIENGLPHVYVNQVGAGEVFTFTGGSMVVSPDGQIDAAAGDNGEAVTVAHLELPFISTLRPRYLELLRDPPPTVRTAGRDGKASSPTE